MASSTLAAAYIVGVVSGGVAVVGDGIVDIEAAKSTENVTFLSNGAASSRLSTLMPIPPPMLGSCPASAA
jgi:hypothetical protein